jgi:hypothetical protein
MALQLMRNCCCCRCCCCCCCCLYRCCRLCGYCLRSHFGPSCSRCSCVPQRLQPIRDCCEPPSLCRPALTL